MEKVPFLKKAISNTGVVFELGNGQTVTIELAKMSTENKARALLHGVSQKGGDSVAGCSKDSAFGAAFKELEAIRDLLYTNEWTFAREGGKAGTSLDDLAAAVARLKHLEYTTVRLSIEKMDTEKRKSWAANPKVAAVVAELKAARLAKAAEGADLEEIEFDLAEEEEAGKEKGKGKKAQ